MTGVNLMKSTDDVINYVRFQAYNAQRNVRRKKLLNKKYECSIYNIFEFTVKILEDEVAIISQSSSPRISRDDCSKWGSK